MNMPFNLLPTIKLKSGKEKLIRNKHPWIFSGAVAHEPANLLSGAVVNVVSSEGSWLARGLYSKKSQIRVRILTWDENQSIDQNFWMRRIKEALAARESVFAVTNGVRIVHGESDGLPGLIVDRYDSVVVTQFLTAGMELHRHNIIQALIDLCANVSCIYDRSDDHARELEGLPKLSGVVWKKDENFNPEALTRVRIKEHKMELFVDVISGHKTGYYLDQRTSRKQIGEFARNKRVLNCFSYTGGFSVSALLAGASEVTSVDASGPALSLAAENIGLNCDSKTAANAKFVEADVFQFLREQAIAKETYDLIILDPPKFISSASQIDKGCRGYKDINLWAMRLLKPNGLLATFSCSGHMSEDLFRKVLFGAALDANAGDIAVIGTFFQAEDHPVSLRYPEGFYLKGLLCQKMANL
jgi:23S rRNA (cytosine1962-C5)-methyltransferase